MQAEFCRSDALYRAFVGGRGAGKSWAISYDLIRRARRGRLYMMVSPTYTVLADTDFRMFLGLAREFGCLSGFKVSPPTATLTTGAEVLFRSADNPEKLRGPNLTGVVLNEASLMARDAYDISIASLREGGEVGWLSAGFTPKGPTHWTYEVFATGKPNTAMFRSRTDENPFLDETFAATIQQQYGDTQFSRQELGGEFVQMEGAEFPAQWFDYPGFLFEDWPEEMRFKVAYLDPSKGRADKPGDWQCYCLAGLGKDNVIYLDAEFNREPVTEMVSRGIRIAKQWGPLSSLALEDNGTMGFLAPEVERQMREARVLIPWHVVTNTEPKLFRIRGLGGYLSRRQIRIRNTEGGRRLRDQLKDVPFGSKEPGGDDGPDAAAGAVRRLEQLTQGG